MFHTVHINICLQKIRTYVSNQVRATKILKRQTNWTNCVSTLTNLQVYFGIILELQFATIFIHENLLHYTYIHERLNLIRKRKKEKGKEIRNFHQRSRETCSTFQPFPAIPFPLPRPNRKHDTAWTRVSLSRYFRARGGVSRGCNSR